MHRAKEFEGLRPCFALKATFDLRACRLSWMRPGTQTQRKFADDASLKADPSVIHGDPASVRVLHTS